MKTKQQKKTELDKAEQLLAESKVLVFTDFSKVPTEELRKLRRDLRQAGAPLLVIKKRLLNVLFKQKGHQLDTTRFDGAVGTVFSTGALENVAATIYKFFRGLKLEANKILGAYDIGTRTYLEAANVTMIGQLPPREVLLGQLVGMLAAPIRSFMFVLDQQSKKS
ncbi:MAG: 50S ribosomal protein L10 [Candidatus Liptonbacteria bacterium]|nr:50S ribosomal protein L10 [Candidatus Liptonbacteria bacterium]